MILLRRTLLIPVLALALALGVGLAFGSSSFGVSHASAHSMTTMQQLHTQTMDGIDCDGPGSQNIPGCRCHWCPPPCMNNCPCNNCPPPPCTWCPPPPCNCPQPPPPPPPCGPTLWFGSTCPCANGFNTGYNNGCSFGPPLPPCAGFSGQGKCGGYGCPTIYIVLGGNCPLPLGKAFSPTLARVSVGTA